MINCLNASHFIIILMRSLCCLPKCGVNPQVSLLFIVCVLFKVFSLGFSFKYSKTLDTIVHEENNEMYSRNCLNSLDLLSSELFIIINLVLYFKSLIQNHLKLQNHQNQTIYLFSIWLINLFNYLLFMVWFHPVPCDCQPSWIT